MVFFIPLLCSILITWGVISTSRYHGHLSNDNDLTGVQKYHLVPTPRIGGVAIFFSILLSILFYVKVFSLDYVIGLSITLLIVFIGGILEDVTKRVSPLVRMSFFLVATLVAVYITKVLPHIVFAGFDWLNHLIQLLPVIGLLLSLFCVIGLTNAYNIVDGYNGLAAIAAICNLIGLVFLVLLIGGDTKVLYLAVISIGAIGGFLVFNYPKGKIFLGDGGAYLIGFMIAILSIYLIQIHHEQISPYAVLLMAIYPITEIGFSIYRRKFLLKTQGMQPDNMHLHQLIYRRCLPNAIKDRNAKVVPLMLFFILPQIFLTLIVYKSTRLCLVFILAYIVFYVVCYFKIVKFKTFRFLKILL